MKNWEPDSRQSIKEKKSDFVILNVSVIHCRCTGVRLFEIGRRHQPDLPFVFGPALAMLTKPSIECVNLNPSSATGSNLSNWKLGNWEWLATQSIEIGVTKLSTIALSTVGKCVQLKRTFATIDALSTCSVHSLIPRNKKSEYNQLLNHFPRSTRFSMDRRIHQLTVKSPPWAMKFLMTR